jgi:epoxyqueuosine reductase
MHWSMEWMAARADLRRGTQSMWPAAKSVIALGMSYAPEAYPLAPGEDKIYVYAHGRDYHDSV